MKQTKNIERKINNRLTICAFCEKSISNITIRPLVCICIKNNFFHYECYEKGGPGADVNKIVKDFLEASVKD